MANAKIWSKCSKPIRFVQCPRVVVCDMESQWIMICGWKNLHSLMKSLEEKTEEDNERLTSKWDLKPKVSHWALASATNEVSKIRLDVWCEQRWIIACWLSKRKIHQLRRVMESSAHYGTQSIQWHRETKTDHFGSSHWRINLLAVPMRIIPQGEIGKGIRIYDDKWTAVFI